MLSPSDSHGDGDGHLEIASTTGIPLTPEWLQQSAIIGEVLCVQLHMVLLVLVSGGKNIDMNAAVEK